MNLPRLIAGRYLRAKRTFNAINIMSLVSSAGVMVGTAALVIILSVFNGFEQLIFSLYNVVDAELKIEPHKGQTLNLNDPCWNDIKKIKGVKVISPVIEQNVLLKYGNRQYFAIMKGVTNDSVLFNRLSARVVAGDLLFSKKEHSLAILGQGVAGYLQAEIMDVFNPLQVYLPDRKNKQPGPLNEDALKQSSLMMSGVVNIQQEFDAKYMLVSFDFASELCSYNNECNYAEIRLFPGYNETDVKKQILKLSNQNLSVKTRSEQHELLMKIMNTEKWAVFFILLFILIIASFNVIGSLTMLSLEKERDMSLLKTLGMQQKQLNRIYLYHGMALTLAGAISGIVIGTLIAWIQQEFGLIKLGNDGNFVVDAYPVKIQMADLLYVLLSSVLIGFSASLYATWQSQKHKKSLAEILKNA